MATPGLVRTEDWAPAGRLARIAGRQVTVMIGHQAACSVRVTPIIDLNEELEATEVQLSARDEYTREPVLCRFARVLTYAAVLVEIIAADGPVDVFTPDLGGSVIHGASVNAAGATQE